MIDCGYLVGLARQSRKHLAFLVTAVFGYHSHVLNFGRSSFVVSLQDEVLIAGFGRRGHAVGDIPGVRFKV